VSFKAELIRKNNNGSLIRLLRPSNLFNTKTFHWILEEETFMPTRPMQDGTNFSSLLMDTSSPQRITMSSKFPQVVLTQKIDKFQEPQRITTNGNNGRSFMLMKLNLNQLKDLLRTGDSGLTDHSTLYHNYQKEDIFRDYQTTWLS